MALLNITKDRTYNLPWESSIKIGIWISVIFNLLPDFQQFPIGSIFGTGVLLYFAFLVEGPNQLGLSLKLSRKVIRWLLGIVIVFLVIDFGIIFLIDATKKHVAAHPEEGPFVEEIVEWDYGNHWKPDSTLYPALSKKDLSGTMKAMTMPFIEGHILAPLFETVIFFAILFPALWRRWNYYTALWISMGAFALVHFPSWTILWFVSLLIFAYIMIKLYIETGSIYPSILFHTFINFTVDVLHLSINWGLPYNPAGG